MQLVMLQLLLLLLPEIAYCSCSCAAVFTAANNASFALASATEPAAADAAAMDASANDAAGSTSVAADIAAVDAAAVDDVASGRGFFRGVDGAFSRTCRSYRPYDALCRLNFRNWNIDSIIACSWLLCISRENLRHRKAGNGIFSGGDGISDALFSPTNAFLRLVMNGQQPI